MWHVAASHGNTEATKTVGSAGRVSRAEAVSCSRSGHYLISLVTATSEHVTGTCLAVSAKINADGQNSCSTK
jgi:hypothetical protein